MMIWPSRAHNVAVAAVWRTILRQPLKFPRKNTQSGIWWGPYQRSLREERGAPQGAKTMENAAFCAPTASRADLEVTGRPRDGPPGPKSSRPLTKSSRAGMISPKIIPSSRLLGNPETSSLQRPPGPNCTAEHGRGAPRRSPQGSSP